MHAGTYMKVIEFIIGVGQKVRNLFIRLVLLHKFVGLISQELEFSTILKIHVR